MGKFRIQLRDGTGDASCIDTQSEPKVKQGWVIVKGIKFHAFPDEWHTYQIPITSILYIRTMDGAK